MRRTTRPHCMHNGFGQILAVQLEVHPKKKLREPSFSSNFLSDFFGGGGAVLATWPCHVFSWAVNHVTSMVPVKDRG